MYQHSWAEINLNHLEYNLNQIAKFAPVQKIMAVVKANAYGHTCRAVVPFLQRLGVQHFAVSNEYEALDLRRHGVTGTVLVLGRVDPAAAAELSENGVTVAVFSPSYARGLAEQLPAGKTLCCHIKLDTGMGRLGLNCREHWQPTELAKAAKEIVSTPGLQVTGAFTHFAAADTDGDCTGAFTAGQYRRFATACESLKALLPGRQLCLHCSNSAATLLQKDFKTSLYRAGIIMYGCTPSNGLQLPVTLKPVFSFKTVISQIKTVQPGESLSYGRTFTAKEPIKVATIAAGYADGYMRGLSGKGSVWLHGVLCPLLGRICMDQAMIDVTHCPAAKPGDAVELFGEHLPVEQPAALLQTINYELLCAVSHRVPRLVLQNGKVVDTVRYESY